MGHPWDAFPSHVAGVFLRLRVYLLASVWLSVAALRLGRAELPSTNRGDAAAATWIIPRRRVAPRVPRGWS